MKLKEIKTILGERFYSPDFNEVLSETVTSLKCGDITGPEYLLIRDAIKALQRIEIIREEWTQLFEQPISKIELQLQNQPGIKLAKVNKYKTWILFDNGNEFETDCSEHKSNTMEFLNANEY